MACRLFKWADLAQKCTLAVIFVALWGIAFTLFGEDVGPQSDTVMLCTLFIGAKIFGYLVSLLKCPPILGQMFFGILLQNVGYFNLSPPFKQFAAILRQLALINIMLPAGLNLNADVLKSNGIIVILLAIVPALIEVLIMAGLALLLHIKLVWAILMGLILAAVSPSVIFPCLFHLEDNGYGLNKGVNTLVVASSTLNDIVSIAVFVAHLSIIFSKDGSNSELWRGPVGFIIGFIFGIIWGILARLIPDKSDNFVVILRTLLIGIGSVLVCMASDALGFSSAGVLGCIVSAFVASQGWRREGWIGDKNPVKYNFMILWKFFEPISFGLIGVGVKFHLLHGLAILYLLGFSLIALIGRIISTYAIVYFKDFSGKEKIFFALSAIPKATVQAALGPAALDKATTEDEEKNAMNVLVLSVLSIIITAPIGAWLILTFGPKLLPRKANEQNELQGGDDDIS
ncbi:sodium/hydrogen exchanger 9B2-like [Chrysoperla carnea]|uniref:sodium/hydrogen exchanger 9B2-like n=1 Tax=Chrysoperla carnea TaxID=189513 RepID=UPI001D0838AB|nr:sodium/hydrogen exchanger 9B2-like [Chrysoperla carnea]